jgi:hypothetical protein
VTANEEIKQLALVTAEDLAEEYLRRRDDEELPRDVLEHAIDSGVVTFEEIAAAFRKGLEERWE